MKNVSMISCSSARSIKCAVEAFHAALLTVSDPDGPKSLRYRVEGGAGMQRSRGKWYYFDTNYFFICSFQRRRPAVHNAVTRCVQEILETRQWDSFRSSQSQEIRQSQRCIKGLSHRFDKNLAKRYLLGHSDRPVEAFASNVAVHSIFLVIEQAVAARFDKIVVNRRGNGQSRRLPEYSTDGYESQGIDSRNVAQGIEILLSRQHLFRKKNRAPTRSSSMCCRQCTSNMSKIQSSSRQTRYQESTLCDTLWPKSTYSIIIVRTITHFCTSVNLPFTYEMQWLWRRR